MSEQPVVYTGTIEDLAGNDLFMSELSGTVVGEFAHLLTWKKEELLAMIIEKSAAIEEANRIIQVATFYLNRKGN